MAIWNESTRLKRYHWVTIHAGVVQDGPQDPDNQIGMVIKANQQFINYTYVTEGKEFIDKTATIRRHLHRDDGRAFDIKVRRDY